MPRNFDGAGDELRTSLGGCGLTGAFTVVVVFKKNGNPAGFQSLCTVHSTSGSAFGLELEGTTDGQQLQIQSGNAFPTSTFTITASDNWCLLAGGKAAGTTTPRAHKYVFDTNTWTHQDAGATAGNPPSTIGGTVRFGLWEGLDDLNGDLAAAAIFDRNLTDAEVEQLGLSFNHWYQLQPVGMWIFDQQATGTAVNDLTGNGAQQSALTGTTVSTNSGPNLGYGWGGFEWRAPPSGGATNVTGAPGDAAFTGVAGLPVVLVAGNPAVLSSSGVSGTPSPLVAGNPAVAAFTGVAGTPLPVTAGSPATATFSGVAGNPVALVAGSPAVASFTVVAGSPSPLVAGSPPSAALSGVSGSPLALVGGSPPSAAFSAVAGSPVALVAGNPAIASLSAVAGTVKPTIVGSPATATFSVVAGSTGGAQTVAGAPADAAFSIVAGSPQVQVAGSPAVATLSALAGAPQVKVAGNPASAALSGVAGVPVAVVAGNPATLTFSALGGTIQFKIGGNPATLTLSAVSGTPQPGQVAVAGVTAVLVFSAVAGNIGTIGTFNGYWGVRMGVS